MATKTVKVKRSELQKTAPAKQDKSSEIKELGDYAVLHLGSKQQLVQMGDEITVELMPEKIGSKIELQDVVLMTKQGDKIELGKPYIAGVIVKATVVRFDKGEKLIVFKKKRRKHYRRKTGHRQHYTVLKIDAVGGMTHGS